MLLVVVAVMVVVVVVVVVVVAVVAVVVAVAVVVVQGAAEGAAGHEARTCSTTRSPHHARAAFGGGWCWSRTGVGRRALGLLSSCRRA